MLDEVLKKAMYASLGIAIFFIFISFTLPILLSGNWVLLTYPPLLLILVALTPCIALSLIINFRDEGKRLKLKNAVADAREAYMVAAKCHELATDELFRYSITREEWVVAAGYYLGSDPKNSSLRYMSPSEADPIIRGECNWPLIENCALGLMLKYEDGATSTSKPIFDRHIAAARRFVVSVKCPRLSQDMIWYHLDWGRNIEAAAYALGQVYSKQEGPSIEGLTIDELQKIGESFCTETILKAWANKLQIAKGLRPRKYPANE